MELDGGTVMMVKETRRGPRRSSRERQGAHDFGTTTGPDNALRHGGPTGKPTCPSDNCVGSRVTSPERNADLEWIWLRRRHHDDEGSVALAAPDGCHRSAMYVAVIGLPNEDGRGDVGYR